MTSEAAPAPRRPRWQEFYELTKPKVVMLIAFTAVVGMFLAVPGMVPLQPLLFGTAGIWLAAASAAAINHVIDANIDADMGRIPKVSPATKWQQAWTRGIADTDFWNDEVDNPALLEIARGKRASPDNDAKIAQDVDDHFVSYQNYGGGAGERQPKRQRK